MTLPLCQLSVCCCQSGTQCASDVPHTPLVSSFIFFNVVDKAEVLAEMTFRNQEAKTVHEKKQVQALCSWIFSSDSVQQVVGIFFPEFISNALQVLDYVNAFLAPVRLLLISNFFFTCCDKWDFLKRFCVYVDQSMESTVLFKADIQTQTSGFCSLNTYSSKDELEGWTCVCSEV